MADLNKNKINDKQKRRAERIKGRLQDQGLGRDHAEKVATEQAVEQVEGGRGGGKSGGAQAPSRQKRGRVS